MDAKKIEQNIVSIKENLFDLERVPESLYTLALVGNHETLIQDICGEDTTDCLLQNEHFIKLTNSEIFESLSDQTQSQIESVNEYFSGDSIEVVNSLGTVRESSLNMIDEDLGNHELTLIETKVIPQLRVRSFGGIFWPSATSDEENIEAFTTSIGTTPVSPSDDSSGAVCKPGNVDDEVYCAQYQSYDTLQSIRNYPSWSYSRVLRMTDETSTLSCINPYDYTITDTDTDGNAFTAIATYNVTTSSYESTGIDIRCRDYLLQCKKGSTNESFVTTYNWSFVSDPATFTGTGCSSGT